MDIPDFSQLLEKANEIQALSRRKNLLSYQLDRKEAKIVLEAVFSSQRTVNGKSPSMDFIKTTWMKTGFNDELLPLREEFAIISADLEKSKTDLDLMRLQIDIWRTESATNRMTLL